MRTGPEQVIRTLRARIARPMQWAAAAVAACAAVFAPHLTPAATPLSQIIQNVVQPRMVKIYGAGGVRGLEAYQSGFLISPEGHILTARSYVLDTDLITATLNDGRRFQAELLGADPRLEIALLKIDLHEAPCFDLNQTVSLHTGDAVLAFSNLFGIAAGDEPTSVLHGRVSAVTTLDARRGAFNSLYHGPVYVLDAITNNPGAEGGALTNRQGALAGILGKELRSAQDNTWLNYAIPASELLPSVQNILAGKTTRPPQSPQDRPRPAQPLTLSLLGVVLVPNVLPQTPPFVDQVAPDSPAQQAGLQPDDLILLANNRIVRSRDELLDELSHIDRIDPLRLTVQRGQQLVELVLRAP